MDRYMDRQSKKLHNLRLEIRDLRNSVVLLMEFMELSPHSYAWLQFLKGSFDGETPVSLDNED